MKVPILFAICVLSGSNVQAADLSNYFERPGHTDSVKSHRGTNAIQVKGESVQECYSNLDKVAQTLDKNGKILVETIGCQSQSSERGTVFFF